MKDDKGFIIFDTEHPEPDPAVQSLISSGQKREKTARLSPKERQKKARERAKAAKRNRMMLDIPPEIERWLVEQAEEIGCPISQLAALLLALGIGLVESGEVDVADYRRINRTSRRYEYDLEIPNIPSQRDTPKKIKGHP